MVGERDEPVSDFGDWTSSAWRVLLCAWSSTLCLSAGCREAAPAPGPRAVSGCWHGAWTPTPSASVSPLGNGRGQDFSPGRGHALLWPRSGHPVPAAWRKMAPCPTQAEHACGEFSDPGHSWASLGQVVTMKLGELSGSDLGTRLTPSPVITPSVSLAQVWLRVCVRLPL